MRCAEFTRVVQFHLVSFHYYDSLHCLRRKFLLCLQIFFWMQAILTLTDRQCTHYFHSSWLIFASFVCNCASKSINYHARQLNCICNYTRIVTKHIDNDSTRSTCFGRAQLKLTTVHFLIKLNIVMNHGTWYCSWFASKFCGMHWIYSVLAVLQRSRETNSLAYCCYSTDRVKHIKFKSYMYANFSSWQNEKE